MSADYLKYWSLTHRPFLEQSFFQGSPQREAIAGIAFFAASDCRYANLAGPPRCGTSVLLQHVASMQGLCDCAVEMLTSDAKAIRSESDLPIYLATALNLPPASTLNDFRDRLQKNLHCGIRTIWLIDRTTPATADLLQSWSRECPELSIVVACQNLCAVSTTEHQRIDLNPLEQDDALQYVQRGILHAAGDPGIFSNAATVRLHERCHGRIADIAVLAEQALADAATAGHQFVNTELVDAVATRCTKTASTAAAA
ncbi:MAG: hypothetical protein VYA84_07580 [Planctomycetota bacterium]|nr:hypothetical protein [Planctomycetota bacterium]